MGYTQFKKIREGKIYKANSQKKIENLMERKRENQEDRGKSLDERGKNLTFRSSLVGVRNLMRKMS